MNVSVVIRCRDEEDWIGHCLTSVFSQSIAKPDVVIVDSGSRDRTLEIAARFPQVKYLRQANRGLSAARNTGLRVADGEIVAYTDSDCMADEDWLFLPAAA